MSNAEDPSTMLARAVADHCQMIRQNCDTTTFAFGDSVDQMTQVIKSAFNLSLELHEGRPIRGSILLVDDAQHFLSQIPTWPFARLDLVVPDLSYRTIKSVAATLNDNMAILLTPEPSGFRLHGLLLLRYRPSLFVQRGMLHEGTYERLPLSVEIQWPGSVLVSIGMLTVGVRRGDSVRIAALDSPAIFISVAVLGYTGHWGEGAATARLLSSAVHEIAKRRTGGTIVVGPRIALDDRQLVQPTSVAIRDLSIPACAVSDFPTWLTPELTSEFEEYPLRVWLRYRDQELSHEELVDMLASMASADGAVLIDETGQVYAYHVYFATPAETRNQGEGGRHAAVRGFMNSTKAWFAVIVSQDGTVTAFARDWASQRLMEQHYDFAGQTLTDIS